MKTQTAQLNYLRIAPRKVRFVADLIRGASVNDAEALLMHQPRRPAAPLLKLLRSAVQNAKHNQKLDPNKLVVESIRVDQGPMLKRYLPRARGMATPIQKKMSHVTLVLVEKETKTPKFKIVVEKKTKLPSGDKKTKKEKSSKQVARESMTRSIPEKKPGFFKRFFRRKAAV